ncbi:MAG: adenylate/guanylate cyclase domain-containing protein, partial [Pseudomonadota bacterium]|nr:adenylate/guanylate cyclase domain-containing protein [Pseudomonadota bacterium]
RLREAGVPVERATLGSPLLHPIAQSSYAAWTLDKGGEDNWFRWAGDNLRVLANSPIHDIYVHGRGHRLKLFRAADRDRFGIGPDLAAQGYSEYAAIPLPFSDGSAKAFTAATRQEGGFRRGQYNTLCRLAMPLSAVLETLVLRRTAATLLDTYVGPRSGRQVLDGRIARGDGERIGAVIWMSDLRGFTSMSAQLGDQALLDRLNAYFEVVTGAIGEQGGETLKFIGDAVLAIFPTGRDPAAAARRAEAAADMAIARQSAADWPQGLEFGVALHVGEVFYGNVGGTERLDFTVIGPAVNLVSRIEGLCGQLGAPLLVSAEFAALSTHAYARAGRFALKGVAGETEVFRPGAR